VPPLAQIQHFVEPLRLVEELSLVNQESGVAPAALHRVDDFVERHDLVLKLGIEYSQRQKSASQLAGDGDLQTRDVVRRQLLPRHDDRAVIIANRSAVWQ